MSFLKTVEYLTENGFKRVDDKHSNNQVSMDFVKFYGKPGKVGEAWKTNIIAGIECLYDITKKNPAVVSFHIPFLREVMENYEKMNENVKNLISKAKCGGCRYCVQMDKTKTKPLRYVDAGGKKLCPLYAFPFAFYDIGGDYWFADLVKDVMEFVTLLFEERLENC